MLGGDKAFSDRLSWGLLLPLSTLAFFATSVAMSGVSLMLWPDNPPRWYDCLTLAASGFMAVRAGAAVAPARKFRAAGAVTVAFALYAGAVLTGVLGVPAAKRRNSWGAAFLLGGAALACGTTWNLKDDAAETSARKGE